jgi:hypothetical protein
MPPLIGDTAYDTAKEMRAIRGSSKHFRIASFCLEKIQIDSSTPVHPTVLSIVAFSHAALRVPTQAQFIQFGDEFMIATYDCDDLIATT